MTPTPDENTFRPLTKVLALDDSLVEKWNRTEGVGRVYNFTHDEVSDLLNAMTKLSAVTVSLAIAVKAVIYNDHDRLKFGLDGFAEVTDDITGDLSKLITSVMQRGTKEDDR